MRQLMISLDKKILDKDSAAARRMVEYGKTDELFILIPAGEKKAIQLSGTVHVFSTGGNKLQQLWRLKEMGLELAKKNEIKFITTQDPFFLGKVGCWLKKKTGAKLEVQVHGDFFGDHYKKQWLKLHMAKFVLKRADSVRTVGERVKQSLLKVGVEEKKIVVRPVILNTKPAVEPTVVQGQKSFVWVGRMEPEKNLFFLVDVFFEVVRHKPDAQLILVGEGSQEKSLRQKVQKLKLEKNITFVSWLPSPIGYIKNVRALLLPSLTESYGAVAMEAQAVGTPVIMSDVGVANYELKPSDKVKILPINDRDKWIETILEVASR